jgi:CheY-like chemotaxis protein
MDTPALAESPTSPANLANRLVLCVDNEEEILAGMSALLTRWGMRVVTARSAAEARERFTAQRPHVVLADYRLGDSECDGLDLLQSLRVGGVRPVPGALITADHGAAVTERARSLGYTVLRKPLKPAALRALLGSLAAA